MTIDPNHWERQKILHVIKDIDVIGATFRSVKNAIFVLRRVDEIAAASSIKINEEQEKERKKEEGYTHTHTHKQRERERLEINSHT